jgi:hypothetical protein
MGQTEGVGVVFNDDIVGDDEFFNSGSDRITKREIGFKQEGFGGGGDTGVGFEASLGGNDCGANGLARLKFL